VSIFSQSSFGHTAGARAVRGQCEGATGAKKCPRDRGFFDFERVRGLFSKLRGSMDIGVVGGGAGPCVPIVGWPDIEKLGFALAPALNSRNPRPVRVSSAPVGVICCPRTLANTLATGAEPIREPVPIAALAYKSDQAGGARRMQDGQRDPSARSQREPATHAALTRQNAPAESAP
jgi:hypothetical protein